MGFEEDETADGGEDVETVTSCPDEGEEPGQQDY